MQIYLTFSTSQFSAFSNEIPHFEAENHNNIPINYNSPCPTLPSTSSNPSTPSIPYKFIEEPDDIHAQLGTSLTLNCIISHTNGTVQWTKNHFGLGIDRDLMAYKRYSMIGDEKSGSYSLHIVAVNFKDEGIYQCQFSNHDVQMRSRYATVTVFREVEIVKKGKIVGEAVKYEKLEANSGHTSKIANLSILIGILNILSIF
jgi:hypothetical protein